MLSNLLKTLFSALVILSISACGSHYSLIKKENFDMAEQCVAQQSQLLEQQEAFQSLFAQLNATLSQPLSIQGPAVQLVHNNDYCEQPVVTHSVVGANSDQKQIVGEVEQVHLPELGFATLGRIDTGATTSSLSATDIRLFERDGEQWVRFNIQNPETGQTVQFEKLRLRKVKINQANSSTAETRPVIQLQLTIGSITQTAEFTLSDRSHLRYQALIGRNVLRDVMLVDVSRSMLASSPASAEQEQSE